MTTDVTISASDARERFSELLERIDGGRVVIQKHGKDRAYLISVRELRALEETVAVLDNHDLMRSIKRGLDDISAGRVQDADDAFAELDAEFQDGE